MAFVMLSVYQVNKTRKTKPMTKLKVADLVIKLDLPDEYLGVNMHKFHCNETKKEDVLISMSNNPMPQSARGKIIHTTYSHNGSNYYVFSEADFITYFQFNDSYSEFIINKNDSGHKYYPDAVQSALRRIFIMIAAARGGVCLHASTIGINGEAVCFSASSGVGKTTHTNLWRAAFPEVEVINGDMGYLFAENGVVYYYSAPWCGTSGECLNIKAPVRSIVFLEQSKQNEIQKLPVPESFMRLCTRCFMPAWDKNLSMKSIETAETLSGITDCRLLKCLPNKESAKVCHYGIYNQ